MYFKYTALYAHAEVPSWKAVCLEVVFSWWCRSSDEKLLVGHLHLSLDLRVFQSSNSAGEGNQLAKCAPSKVAST